MNETSTSLLQRVTTDGTEEAWSELVELYTPMIRAWLRRHSASQQDADDLVQEVLSVVIRKLPKFQRIDRTGAFRSWLRSITVNCLRDSWKAQKYRPKAGGSGDFQQMLEQLEDPNSGVSHVWNEEHDRHVTQYLLQRIQPMVTEPTWDAFRLTAVEGQTAEDAAEQLGMTVNAVYIARSRVLSRLRQEGRGLIDDSSD